MTKAVIKAMDTVSDISYSKHLTNTNITRFIISGASKRGWTTWLTAAADKRVIAFAPIVMDMAHFHPNLKHMYQSYGGWTLAFADYYAENITKNLDTSWMHDFFIACDPYYFFDRYINIPKIIIDATNDEFFMPDDERYWWNSEQFSQPKYFEMIADAEHSMATGIQELVPSLSTFAHGILAELALPTINWTIDYSSSNTSNINGSDAAAAATGNITLYYYGNTSQIVEARQWQGRSCGDKRRDFRFLNLDSPCVCGVNVDNDQVCANFESLFDSEILNAQSMTSDKAVYFAQPKEIPDNHWLATLISIKVQLFETDHPFVGELSQTQLGQEKDDMYKFKQSGSSTNSYFFTEYGQVVFTSQVSIVPNTFPYPMCNNTDCYGVLV